MYYSTSSLNGPQPESPWNSPIHVGAWLLVHVAKRPRLVAFFELRDISPTREKRPWDGPLASPWNRDSQATSWRVCSSIFWTKECSFQLFWMDLKSFGSVDLCSFQSSCATPPPSFASQLPKNWPFSLCPSFRRQHIVLICSILLPHKIWDKMSRLYHWRPTHFARRISVQLPCSICRLLTV